MALLSIKINIIFIPWYLASILQVPARFHEKNNNLSILENGMSVQVGFSSFEILHSGIGPPNTLRKILEVFKVHNISPQQLFITCFPSSCTGLNVLVPSPFLVRPVSDQINLKKYLS
jgi:hypothetical protein